MEDIIQEDVETKTEEVETKTEEVLPIIQPPQLPTGPNLQFDSKPQYFRKFMLMSDEGEVLIQNIEYSVWTASDGKTYPQLWDVSQGERQQLHILFPFGSVSSSNMYISRKTGFYGTFGDVEYFTKTDQKGPFDITKSTQTFSLCDRVWQNDERESKEILDREMSLCCDFLESLGAFLFTNNLENPQIWAKDKKELLAKAYANKKNPLTQQSPEEDKLEYLASMLTLLFKSPVKPVTRTNESTQEVTMLRYTQFSRSVFDDISTYKKKPALTPPIQKSKYLLDLYENKQLFFNDIPLLEAKTMQPILNINQRSVQPGDIVTVEARVKPYDVAGKTGFKLEPQFLIKYKGGHKKFSINERILSLGFQPIESAEDLFDENDLNQQIEANHERFFDESQRILQSITSTVVTTTVN